MPNTLKYCAIIPVYNHGNTVETIVKELNKNSLHTILVNDASTDNSLELLKDIVARYSTTSLVSLDVNQGKGGAVMAGLNKALELNYTHALQIDADGQHEISVANDFIDSSKKHPTSIICGYPQYDDSVPSSRKIGRKITNFWCAIETISMDIKDAMCGFRIYPVAQTCQLINSTKLGTRMDFDIEILVKLHWMGIPMIFKEIKVYYPEDGSSHFRMLQDNLSISWIHTRLTIGAIIRSPYLLWKKFFSNANKDAYNNENNDPKHWADKKEKSGSVWQMRLIYKIYKLVGIRNIRILLHPIVAVFFLVAKDARKNSENFLKRVQMQNSMDINVKKRDIYNHIFSFAYSMIEKLSSWDGGKTSLELICNTPDREVLVKQLEDKKGAVIICSHLGNIEMLRAFATNESGINLPDIKLTAIVDFAGAKKFNSLLEEINKDSILTTVNASDISPAVIINLQDSINAGNLIAIAADRTARNNRAKTSEINFLGDKAYFPKGSFILASLLEAPIYYMFAVRQDDHDFDSSYEFHIYKSKFSFEGSRKERKAKILKFTQEFAEHLENLCIKHPLQWFNFFDFWKNPDSDKK